MDSTKFSKHEEDLVKAVREANWNQINCLLIKNPVDLQSEQEFDYYLVREALIKRNVEVAKFLIGKGFRVSKNNLIEWEKTVLHYAAEYGDANLIILLLTKGALRDINRITVFGETPIHIAIRKRKVRVIRVFLSNLVPKIHINDEDYIHCAIKKYDWKLFQLLLEKGLSVLAKDENNMTPFCVAIDLKKFECLELLFSHYEIKKSDIISYDNAGPFFVASICGNLNFIKKMLNTDVLTVNSQVMSSSNEWFLLKNCCGWTALHFAVKHDKIDIVEFLLNKGASVMIQDKFGNTPIHIAFETKNYKILDLLLSLQKNFTLNPSNEVGITHFHIACTRNDLGIVNNFLQHIDSVDILVSTNVKVNKTNSKDTLSKWQGSTPLHFAVMQNKVKIVQLLLENNASVNVQDANGSTPLHLACKNDGEKFREFILDNYEPWGYMKDWSSNRNDHIEIINLLLQYKAHVNCLDNLGNGAFYYACDFSNFNHTLDHLNIDIYVRIQNSLLKELSDRSDIISSMLLKFNLNFDKCYQNSSILHFILTRFTSASVMNMIKLILQRGADVNATNDTMTTPLHLAVSKGKYEIKKELIELFLDFKANVNCIRSTDHATPLHCVIIMSCESNSTCHQKSECYIDVIELLLEKGADLYVKDKNGMSPLHLLVSAFFKQESRDKISKIILKYIKSSDQIDVKDEEGFTPLFCASLVNNYEAVKFLLDLGADINEEDYRGKTIFYHLYQIIRKGKTFDRAYVKNRIRQQDLGKTINILYCHMCEVRAIGKFISVNVEKFIDKLKSTRYAAANESEEEKCISACKKEINALRSKKINNATSLYDILFKNDNAMAHYMKNTVFVKIMESDEIKRFVFYRHILKRKFNSGLVRSELLPTAKLLLNRLTRLFLPDYCSENIFKYFTNSELKIFATNASLVEKEKLRTYSLRFRKKAIKYQKV